jgi:4-methoxybenzoate monooxygenase (O-demethylating)
VAASLRVNITNGFRQRLFLVRPNFKRLLQLTALSEASRMVQRRFDMLSPQPNGTMPASEIDPFAPDFLADPYPYHQELRELGPVVRLGCYGIWAVTRYEQVSAILNDWQTFGSGGGVGLANFHKEGNWRPPSLLLETDPPMHTRARTVMNRAVAPKLLRELRDGFYREAVRLLDKALELGTFDAVAELSIPYPLKVFPDAVGIAPDEREMLLPYGNMVFNTMGPKNDLYRAALAPVDKVLPWVMQRCGRHALRPGSLGAEVYKYADTGEVTEQEAGLLVRSFLSAGIDTTVHALGNAILCFAEHPGEWQKLRQEPAKARPAFDEVMRFETPFQCYFRTTTRPTEIAGTPIDAGEKIYVSIAAANRDPRRWQEPARFDISRKVSGHVGFGTGIHACVGQMIARMEIEALLTAMVERIAAIELAGKPERLIHNTLRAVAKLPVRMTRLN